MANYKRRNSTEKLNIIEESKLYGVVVTARKYGITPTQVYRWIDKYETQGLPGLGVYVRQADPELDNLKRENQALKELLAEKELALRIKDALLKKTELRTKNGL